MLNNYFENRNRDKSEEKQEENNELDDSMESDSLAEIFNMIKFELEEIGNFYS